MATLTLYGSDVADATLTNACGMALNTTGGTETSQTSTGTGTHTFQEIYSQGGSPVSVTAIPATPTGFGWIFYPGAGSFATGNWSASANIACTLGTGDTVTMRFFKYSGGTYTSIGSLPAITITGHPKTSYSFTATSMSAVTTGASDGIYVDLWWNDPSGVVGDNPVIYESTSATAGVASDMQITTSTFTPSTSTHRIICDGYGGVFS